MIRLSVALMLLALSARADTNSPTWRQLAAIHKAAAESGKPVKMQPHREKAERLVALRDGEPVAVTVFTDGTSRTNRINAVIRTATLGAPVQLPEPPPGNHSKEYLLGFAAGVAATVAGLKIKTSKGAS